jgi:probable phosphoglycerate mutase
MERARETAAPLAQTVWSDLGVCAAINEIDSGAWTGRTFSDLDANEEQWRRFNRFRSATPIPGGEWMVEVQARFVGEMLRLHERFPDERIALVSHAGPIKLALAYFLGVPVDFYDRIEVGLASVSVVALAPWGAKILRLNDGTATVES